MSSCLASWQVIIAAVAATPHLRYSKSINTAANHQPVLVAVAQHGSVDDMIYITATDGGAASGSAASTTAAAAASSAAAKGNTGNNNNQKGNTVKNTPAKGKGNQNNFRPGGRF